MSVKTTIKIPLPELQRIVDSLAPQLSTEDYQVLSSVTNAFKELTEELGKKTASVHRLKKIIFGSKSEKLKDISKTEKKSKKQKKDKPKGHGRNSSKKYTAAKKVNVPHQSLKPGDNCPECEDGTLYQQHKPGIVVRLAGQAPVNATVYKLQKLRCGLCGTIFSAELPKEAGEQKYDQTVPSVIALTKYGYGLPFNRLDKLQACLGTPLPSSTQWDLVAKAYNLVNPAYDELLTYAAQGKVLHNDDTSMQILELSGIRLDKLIEQGEHSGKRTGIYTSGIVSVAETNTIALFFTGNKHAGENIAELLAKRVRELPPPIQMCDALSHNIPKEFKTIVANCNSHGRRKFVEVYNDFPSECKYVLDVFAEIYKHDAIARKDEMSDQQRLEFHQKYSGETMTKLKEWFEKQFEDKLVEPNSSLGGVITYMLKHWQKLTLFLRVPGVPLDNNICERALKKAIIHRKNSMFYKTITGALVGDTFMSLIYTAEIAGTNPFDYLTELQRNAEDLRLEPSRWMPWNYRETLKAIAQRKAA